MSWVESHQALSNHRKTLKAARILRCDKHKLIGHLHELWWWGLDNAAEDGEMLGIELADIAYAAGWTGKPDPATFGLVMIESGFVDTDAEQHRFWLHDWWDYAGKLNSQRELRKESNRESQERHRERQRRYRDRHRDASVTVTVASPERHVSADVTAACPARQHPTVPNLTVDLDPLREDPALQEQEAITHNAARRSGGEREEPADFAEFWQAYPKNTGSRKLTMACWRNLSKADRAAALTGAKHYAASQRVAEGYVKQAEGWLRGRFWEAWQQPETAIYSTLPSTGPPGGRHQPDYSGIREWGERMEQLEGIEA